MTMEEKYVYIVSKMREAVLEATYGKKKAERRKKMRRTEEEKERGKKKR